MFSKDKTKKANGSELMEDTGNLTEDEAVELSDEQLEQVTGGVQTEIATSETAVKDPNAVPSQPWSPDLETGDQNLVKKIKDELMRNVMN